MHYCKIILNLSFEGYKRRTELHWVRLYYATPTFDKITKDEKANFETKLSVIGGTFGLFSGFSIISGVEILYFAALILFGHATKRIWKRPSKIY